MGIYFLDPPRGLGNPKVRLLGGFGFGHGMPVAGARG